MRNAQTKLEIVLTVMLVAAVGVAFGLTGVVSPVFAQQNAVANASSNPTAAVATAATSTQPTNSSSQSSNVGRGSSNSSSSTSSNGQSQNNNGQRGGFSGSNGQGQFNGGNNGGFNGGGRRGFGRIQLDWQTIATTLNLSQADLLSKLNNGETLAQVASEQKVDTQTVQSSILSSLKSQLDQAVQSGQLVQAQADQLYERYTTQVQQLMSQPLNGRR